MMTAFAQFPIDKQIALNFQAVITEPLEDGIFSGEIAKHGPQILPHLITALLLDDEIGQKSRCVLNILKHMAWSGYLCNRGDILDSVIKRRLELAAPSDKESLERYFNFISDAISHKCSQLPLGGKQLDLETEGKSFYAFQERCSDSTTPQGLRPLPPCKGKFGTTATVSA